MFKFGKFYRVLFSTFAVIISFVYFFQYGQVLAQSESVIPTDLCGRKYSGDADCDGKISLFDFELFREEFIYHKDPQSEPSIKLESDFNKDSFVDLNDFEIWRANYAGITTPGSISCNWCGSDCISSDTKRACLNATPPFGKTCERINNVCMVIPPDTIFPKPSVSITYIPVSTVPPNISPTSIANKCSWCGTSCLPFDSSRMCPMVLPPADKQCEYRNTGCTIINGNE